MKTSKTGVRHHPKVVDTFYFEVLTDTKQIEFVQAVGVDLTKTPTAPQPYSTDPERQEEIKIYRGTDVTPLRHEFQPGSSIKAQELNENFKQLRDAIQENTCASSQGEYDFRYWNKINTDDDGDTSYSNSTTEWESDDEHIATNAETDVQYSTIVSTDAPTQGQSPDGVDGKTWFVSDDQLLWIWDNDNNAWKSVKASTEGDTIYNNVWFVSPAGDNSNDGHSITKAMRDIGSAVKAANGENPNGSDPPDKLV